VPDDEPTPGPDPVERLLDLCVFAPLGFVTDARRVLPELAERGRQQATVARMVGEFAVTWGSSRLQDAVAQAQENAVDLLQRLGVASPEPEPAPGVPTTEPAASPDDDVPSQPVLDDRSGPAEPRVADDRNDGDTWSDWNDELDGEYQASLGEVPPEAGDAADLAIPDYDNLSASQVVPRLDGLTPAELEAVGRYERAQRHRKTILNRIAQLQDGLA